jgi:hypothetical protein
VGVAAEYYCSLSDGRGVLRTRSVVAPSRRGEDEVKKGIAGQERINILQMRLTLGIMHIYLVMPGLREEQGKNVGSCMHVNLDDRLGEENQKHVADGSILLPNLSSSASRYLMLQNGMMHVYMYCVQ